MERSGRWDDAVCCPVKCCLLECGKACLSVGAREKNKVSAAIIRHHHHQHFIRKMAEEEQHISAAHQTRQCNNNSNDNNNSKTLIDQPNLLYLGNLHTDNEMRQHTQLKTCDRVRVG